MSYALQGMRVYLFTLGSFLLHFFVKFYEIFAIAGSTRMTWKEKKEIENKKVVSLGGKV